MKIKQLLMLMLMVGIAFRLSAQDVSFYQKYAEKGDKEAMYNLANCYINGNGGVQQDFNQATYWLTKAAKKKYAPAQVSLAYCYLYGAGVLKDYKKAWELAQKAASQNDASANYLISQMYKNGFFVNQSNALYLRYLEFASDLGDDDAQFELAVLCMNGSENPKVQQDIQKALNLYLAAAKQNNGEALLQVGCMTRDGNGFEKDPKLGFQYIESAAQTGLPRALFEYGYVLLNGWGCEQNVSEGVKYITAAAQQEVPNAYKLMGDIYYSGLGVEADDAQAAQWYQKAVDAGYGNAYSQLAWMYLTGRGVSENESKGYQLYKQAADAGYPEGNAGLGLCYENGAGVNQNTSTAVTYYKKAAEAGNNYSQHRLYRIFRKGEGISKDTQEALKYLRMAADDEYPDALWSLGVEYMLGEILHEEKSSAIEYMMKAADKGNVFACGVIGIACYSGEDPFTKDYDKAFKYLSEAVKDTSSMSNELQAEVYKDLGACYRFGRGTSVDNSLASYFTEKAAELGDTGSFDAVKMLRNK